MRARRVLARRDPGFTLVETVVAMSVFAVASTVTLGLVVRTASLAQDGMRRTVAAGLVTTQLESVRSLPATAVPDGLTVTTRTIDVVTYTIRQNANYLPSGASGSVCVSSGADLAYKLVTVSVTWPAMGNVQPVRGDTLKSVGIGSGGLDQSTLGSLAVLVTGYDGTPRSGVTVSLPSRAATRLTGDDGCAVFAALSPGAYGVAASAYGYVGTQNTASVSVASVSVAAASITRTTITYDAARSVAVVLGDATASLPAGMPLRVGSSYVTETTLPTCPNPVTSACTSGLPGTVQSLFPAAYTVKVGACTETSPSQVTVDLRGTATSTPSVTVPVGTVTVDVRNHSGTSLAGRTVTVTHAPGCSETYTLPSTAAGGSALVLPYGSWTLSTPITPGSPTTTTASISVSPAAPAASAVLTVSA